MDDLAKPVHARVSASGTVHPDRLSCHCCKAPFKVFLHRGDVKMGLCLPAVIMTAVVFNPAG